MAKPVWTNVQIIDQLDSGNHWSGTNLTYGFPTNANWTPYGEKNGFSPLNATQQTVATLAIKMWDQLIVPNFTLAADGTTANIKYSNTTTSISYAHAYYPGGGWPDAGSVWFNPLYGANSGTNNLVTPTLGQWGFTAFIHETGHASGVNHPGTYNGGSPTYANDALYAQDFQQYTVMSYFDADDTGADWVASDGKLYFAQTPMMDDILAIQAMYGADLTTRVGNNTYGFNANVDLWLFDFTQNAHPVVCIYDAGGIDTLNLSGWNTACVINLAPGSFSNADMMTYNISIARNTWIENAVGGGGQRLADRRRRRGRLHLRRELRRRRHHRLHRHRHRGRPHRSDRLSEHHELFGTAGDRQPVRQQHRVHVLVGQLADPAGRQPRDARRNRLCVLFRFDPAALGSPTNRNGRHHHRHLGQRHDRRHACTVRTAVCDQLQRHHFRPRRQRRHLGARRRRYDRGRLRHRSGQRRQRQRQVPGVRQQQRRVRHVQRRRRHRHPPSDRNRCAHARRLQRRNLVDRILAATARRCSATPRPTPSISPGSRRRAACPMSTAAAATTRSGAARRLHDPRGGSGNDTLVGGDGARRRRPAVSAPGNATSAGGGNDRFLVSSSDAAADTFNGGAGTETLEVTGSGSLSLDVLSMPRPRRSKAGRAVTRQRRGSTAANTFNFSGLTA